MPTTAVTGKSFAIDNKALNKAAAIYRAIRHPLRLQIVEIIHKAGKINVTPIIKILKLEQPIISAQLKILRDANFLKAERKGKNVFYSVNYKQFNRISKLNEKLILYKTDLFNPPHNLTPKLGKTDAVTFTPMELKVIRLVCEQNTNEEIAGSLGLSRRTIEDHKRNIIRKMKVRNSVGILFFAIKKGLVRI